jgi:hypothetical protein
MRKDAWKMIRGAKRSATCLTRQVGKDLEKEDRAAVEESTAGTETEGKTRHREQRKKCGVCKRKELLMLLLLPREWNLDRCFRQKWISWKRACRNKQEWLGIQPPRNRQREKSMEVGHYKNQRKPPHGH